MNMLKLVPDPEYATKWSHPEFVDRKWMWAVGEDGNLYFKGKISGHGFAENFHKFGDAGIPLDTEDIKKLNDILYL